MCDAHSSLHGAAPRLRRRAFLARAGVAPLLLSPLAGLLAACGKGGWPDGMAPIRWDRDTCIRCKMVISDRRFAAELRGGPAGTVFKFDDIGCLVFWLQEQAEAHPWMAAADTRMWVADFASPSREAMRWLDPRQARYVARSSPMGYNFAALAEAEAEADAVDYGQMRQRTLSRGR
ncbi:nitrous oxide reductase accessory protein NosL [Thauera linaloolentis]|uniref:NosL protein n=1 Tax=Thauera linaloolentis (strain DSM 12138 / JCM 21573 / CCUG 41526 / CIP 105981 / IAM 15112 / NBRC 102519 / 47Lol) TaxID=1123367 RepID=N6YDM8_THAL4|nr:nitrous oxide reductase accessory protein NosL [Thauera linaloolentis]ENO89650.1 hypothetical protein C666_05040 [Thauera linaloolentis 47Lol = DSM 12138]MCM8567130.1 nitrous oxide reductase accessory protein NosL [Thauera linaloolentis]